jgi:hypothetical protein
MNVSPRVLPYFCCCQGQERDVIARRCPVPKRRSLSVSRQERISFTRLPADSHSLARCSLSVPQTILLRPPQIARRGVRSSFHGRFSILFFDRTSFSCRGLVGHISFLTHLSSIHIARPFSISYSHLILEAPHHYTLPMRWNAAFFHKHLPLYIPFLFFPRFPGFARPLFVLPADLC